MDDKICPWLISLIKDWAYAATSYFHEVKNDGRFRFIIMLGRDFQVGRQDKPCLTGIVRIQGKYIEIREGLTW